METILRGLGLPGGNLRLADLAEAALSLSDAWTARSLADAREAGLQAACRKGCAACCRQIIPVSPAEAFLLHERHLALSADLRALREARFQAHRTTLESLPEGPHLLHHPEAYFARRLDCPYLEDATCAIHPIRPLACREHLAVSDPAHCSAFPSHGIRTLPLARPVAEALIGASARLLGGGPLRIPLTSALAWAEENAEAGRRTWPAEEALAALAADLSLPGVGPADIPENPARGTSPRASAASIL